MAAADGAAVEACTCLRQLEDLLGELEQLAVLVVLLLLIALARKIGLRRGGRMIGLAADAYLAQKALRRRAALHRG